MKDPRVGLVLDTGATIAYVNGSVHVGELMVELGDEDRLVGVPVACLAEAAAQLPEGKSAGLAVLARHHAVVVLDGLGEDWEALTGWSQVLGRADCAAALVEATSRPATYVATTEPWVYGDDMGLLIVAI